MTITEAKNFVQKLVADYFGDGHVFFAEAKMTKFPDPYVTIKFLRYRRNTHPCEEMDEDDEYYKSYRGLSATVDMNLYTKGKYMGGSSEMASYANTSLEDMEDFLKYLDSYTVQNSLIENNVSITMSSDIKDMTALEKSKTIFNYRTLVTLTFNFSDVAYGDYGQNGIQSPNYSGGGSPDYITAAVTIENVDVSIKEDKT